MASECECFVNLPSDIWGNELNMMDVPVFNIGEIDFFTFLLGVESRSTRVRVRGQSVQVISLLAPCALWGQNSSCWTW